MHLNGAMIVVAIAALGAIGWFAIGQRSFLRIWLSWTAFCVVLFTLLVVTRAQPTPHNLAIAWAAAPLVGLLGWLRQFSWMDRR